MWEVTWVLLLTVASLSSVNGRSSGAPDPATCVEMFPSGHDPSTADAANPPFTFSVRNMDGTTLTQYTGGETLRVTVTPNADKTFKGFLIKARRADVTTDQSESIGSFAVANAGSMKEACSGSNGNGLTHTAAGSNSWSNGSPLELVWTAPSSPLGHLEFLVTIVETFVVYWVRVKPGDLTLLEDPSAPPLSTGPDITRNAGSALDLSDCSSNNAKGCYTDPSECTSDCDLAVIWTRNGNSFDFEMSAKSDYVALGFSSDESMGEDSVIECIRNKDFDVSEAQAVEAGNSRNDGRANARSSPYFGGITSQTNGIMDGEVRCRFTHDGNGAANQALGGDNTYYLFLAGGSTSGSSKRQHDGIPLISDNKVRLLDFNFVTGSISKPWLIKIHGALMMIAWVMLASIGITLARYYKDVWPDSTLCTQKVWFTIHRSCMITALLLTIAGFIVIFVHVEDWSELEGADPEILKAHPYLGVIVTALAIINPTMAIFRPHPGEPNRVIFNWAHWSVGTLAHVLSMITIFLGLSLPSAEGVAPDWLIWVMVGFVAFHVVIDLILEIHKCNTSQNKGRNSMEMGQMGQNKPPETESFVFRKMLLVVYFVVVTALALVLVITVLAQ